MNRWRLGTAITMAGACALIASPCAAAGRATSQMRASVNVVRSCSVAATPLAFNGVLGFLNRDTTATILVQCSPNTPFAVDLDDGLYPNGIQRRVRNLTSATFLDYEVYRDAARTSRWGEGTGNNVAGTTTNGTSVSLIAYGRLQGGPSLFLGQYADSITVTVSF